MNEGKRRPDRVSLQTLVARGPVVRPNAEPRHAAPEPASQERPITVPTVIQPAAAAPSVQRRPRPAVTVALAAMVVGLAVLAAGQDDLDSPVPSAPEPAVVAPPPSEPAVVAQPDALADAATPEPTPEAEELLVIDDEEPTDDAMADEVATDDLSARRQRARTAARRYTDRAQAAHRAGDRGAAIRLYGYALAALPTYAPAAAGLSKLHYEEGAYKTALTYAKEANRAAPRSLSYMLLVGDAYARLGRTDDAQAMWRHAAELGSTRAQARLASSSP